MRPRLGEALLTLVAGLAAAIPVIAATVRAIAAGWVPVADRGVIATRAHDVFTSHMPLVGQYTLAGEVTGQVTHSLGPMLFWLLAAPAYYGSTVGMTLVMGTVNTLAIVGCVALARRRGGRVLMAMTALAIALMCQSLAAETFHDIWNPSAALFPFTLLIFLCWSLACGAWRLLPVAVLVASFVVQTHLTYLPPTLAIFAVGIGGLATGSIARRRREHRDAAPTLATSAAGDTSPPDDTAAAGDTTPASDPPAPSDTTRQTAIPRVHRKRRRVLAWGLATALVAAACWSATIVGQLTEHPGNLTLVLRSATKSKPTLGATVGWHAVVRAVGIVPWWLRTPKSRWQRKYEVRSRPNALATNSCIAMLAALALVGALALLCRRRELAALALTALVLCPALATVAASTPTSRLLSATLGYTLWWGSQAGMIVWLALAWALWLTLAAAVRAVLARAGARRTAQTTTPILSTPAPDLPTPTPTLSTPTRDLPTPTPTLPTPTPVPSTPTRDLPTPALSAAALGTPAPTLPARGERRRDLGMIASVALALLAVGATAAVGATVAARGEPDEHAVTYAAVRAIDARLGTLVAPGGSVVLEGELDGATMPVKPAVRYFLVTRGTRVLAPGSYLRLGTWYELYKRPFREAIYLSDVPRPPVKRVPLAFDVSFREGARRNTVYVWISRRPGR